MANRVEFKISGKTLEWDEKYENLLEMAEENGIEIESERRQGFCGTCSTKLLSGKVDMETEEGLDEDEIKDGMILPCVSVPLSDLIIEA